MNCITLLLFSCLINQTLGVDLIPAISAIRGISFNLFTLLTVNTKDGGKFKYEIQESYSKPRDRTRIKFKIIGDRGDWERHVSSKARQNSWQFPYEGAIYSAAEYKSEFYIQRLDQQLNSCLAMKPHTLVERFFITRALKPAESLPEHVLGPARILLYLDINRNAMVLSEKKDTRVRNLPAFEYILIEEDESVQYMLSFHVNHTVESLPLRLVIHETDRSSIFDFIGVDDGIVDPQVDNVFLTVSGDDSPKHEELTMDTSSGCVSHLERMYFLSTKIELSFSAKVLAPGYRKAIEFHVAYSSSLKSLRVDQTNETRILTRISNFHQGLQYFLSDDAYNSETLSRHYGECVVAQELSDISKLYVGKLLFGSSYLLYLGKARVRGIQARLYETLTGEFPFWLRSNQFVNHEPLDGGQAVPSTTQEALSDATMRTLVYTTDEDLILREDMNPHVRLLQVEYHQFREGKSYDKLTIQVYDFSWSIPVNFLSGQRGENLFSLADLCPAVSSDDGPVRKGTVEMVLKAKSDESTWGWDWLASKPRRHLALLALIQTGLRLPLTQVSDLHSKILIHQPGESAKLAVSFQSVEHKQDVFALSYVGVGDLKPDHSNNLEIHEGLELHDCLYKLAVRTKESRIIAYRADSATCLIDNSDSVSAKEIFNLGSSLSSTYQVYIFRLHPQPKQRSTLELLPIGLEYNLEAEDVDLELTDIHSNASQRVRLHSLRYTENKENSIIQSAGNAPLSTNKFIGLRLTATDASTKRLKPKQVSSSNWLSNNQPPGVNTHVGLMSFDGCRMACLQDLECESFSVCLIGKEMECLVSSVGFRDPELVAELAQFQATQNGPALTNSLISLANVSIQRDTGCELHNKIYLDSFSDRSVMMATYGQHIQLVNNREDCARLCFKQTLTTLNEKLKLSREIRKDLLAKPHKDADTIRRALDDHGDMMRTLCEKFHYYDHFSQLSRTKLQFFLNLTNVSLEKLDQIPGRGFCMLDGESRVDFPADGLMADEFQLKPEIFFERRAAVKLLGSSATGDSLEAIELARAGGNVLESHQYDLLKSWLNRGENHQVLSSRSKSESQCALACLNQQVQDKPWPMCRSFSIVRTRRLDGSRFEYLCYLNSLTLHEAVRMERFDLIEEQHSNPKSKSNQSSSERLVCQFDARPNFILSESYRDLAAALSSKEQRTEQVSSWNILEIRFYALGQSLIVLLALLFGLVFGIGLANLKTHSSLTNQVVCLDRADLIAATELDNLPTSQRHSPSLPE